MGGPSYDRDVYSGSSYSSWGVSDYSAKVFSSTTLDDDLKPSGKKIVSKSKNPIIICLDVTGSNIDFARLVFDKLPMFYGQIEQKRYLDDFDICICAVGDAYCDSYPIQIGTPAKGLEIDKHLKKIVLEAGGGGNGNESYEIMAHYLANNCEFIEGAHPMVFFIADESALNKVSKEQCEKLGIACAESYNPWPALNKKFNNNVFCMLNKYCGCNFVARYTDSWKKLLPQEHVIKIPEEKAIIDLILGIIAIQSKELNEYTIDMKNRGQTIARIEGVASSLKMLASTTALSTSVEADLPVEMKLRMGGSKGRRL